MPRPPTSRTAVLAVLALAALVALLLWTPEREQHAAAPSPESPPSAADEASLQSSQPRAAGGSSSPASATDCAPQAAKACREGDVWWFDSCGTPEEIAESCDGRSCSGDRCAEDPRCAQVSAYGVCEGDRAVACISGRLISIDCSAKGQRCIDTREGARCAARDPDNGCRSRDRARCVGDRLRECVDGSWAEIDCAARKAACISDGDGARCGPSLDVPEIAPAKIELCGGGDEDDDGRVDEGLSCEAVPLVAFVPEGVQFADFEARIERELAIANETFAPLRFAWARTVPVAASYREVDPDRLTRVAAQLSQQESASVSARARSREVGADARAGLAFYVPILFTERFRVEPPKSGLSTLPNNTCGGVRLSDSPSPPYGLVVLADERTRQTLSHELGHYLGLCHTHEELDRIAAAIPDVPSCKRTGDGICDTPDDRGPDQCYADEACDYYCPATAARPDASNLMSYYMSCRRAFTPEQIAEAGRVLELRRGWFRCLEPADCPCNPALANACPEAMSCHPGTSETAGWSCALEGPGLAGTACRGSSQCKSGSICLGSDRPRSGRCVRLCASNAECKCIPAAPTFKVCAEDLGDLN